MKKEEQQKNKSDEKISFFEGVVKTGESVGFFSQARKFFQNKINAKKFNFHLIKDDEDKGVNTAKGVKNKITPKKENIASSIGNLFRESRAESKKNSNSKQLKFVPDWSASNTLSTNLIKGESTLTYHWNKKIYVLLINVFLVIVVNGFAYGGLLYWEKVGNAANKQLDLRASDLKVRIEGLKKEAEEINIFNEKIALAKNLLDKHVYWNNLFEFLENNILSNVYLENTFSGGTDGEYVFRAYTKDLKTMLDQVNYLRQEDKKDKTLSVEIANVVTNDGIDSEAGEIIDEKYKVSFDLILKINKNIFYKK
ncbi:hypothetical protein L6270_02620 [Candidatus Parcubacteria bacterium]|nr:hypothetical protein [Patescibacteria group bacterium]MBU4309918.1 hypothetical protein [Patescibacteria group bacterium]MBU4432079.1 hypothetical protein [Patescibacteria group bacterium]MBU4577843.1 hypothetical protein [Patescibacteria group bacterium]MCG2696904.1 hypothetical protein [Candidatus Parcubacteria bacterium]